MRAAALLRRARLAAGLSQDDLARRLGTKQPAIARWEGGRSSPSFEALQRALEACGFRFEVRPVGADEGEDALIRQWLKIPPAERLRRNARMLETEDWVRRARRVPESERGDADARG